MAKQKNGRASPSVGDFWRHGETEVCLSVGDNVVATSIPHVHSSGKRQPGDTRADSGCSFPLWFHCVLTSFPPPRIH